MTAPAPDLARVQRRRKLALALGLAALGALFAVSAPLWRTGGWMERGIESLGLALILLCILGRCWCALYIGGRKTHELVTGGPYQISRNPLYVFSFIGAAGAGLSMGAVTPGLLMALLVWGVFSKVVAQEEAFLKGAFGAPYQAYLARVPRFWPDVALWSGGGSVTSDPRLLWITLRDAMMFLLAIPVFELIEALQGAGLWPVLLRLP